MVSLIVLGVVGVLAAAPSTESLRIDLDTIGRRQHVRLTNTGRTPLRLWDDRYSRGYFAISFEIVDARGSITRVGKMDRGWDKNVPASHELVAGGSFDVEAELGSADWILPTLPIGPLSIRAVYEVRADRDSEKQNVWTGRVVSRTNAYVAPASSRELTAADLAAGIRKLGPRHYQIAHALFERTIADGNRLALAARIVPSMRDGKPEGFKIFEIVPDGVFGRLGLENGDVIVTVNDNDLSTPDRALETFSQLRLAHELRVGIDRGPKRLTLTWTIR